MHINAIIKNTAQVTVRPWLSYGCSVGARMLIRKKTAAEGQCATVQRILDDDRCVVRLDGYTAADGVNGETVVDPQPSTIVRTTTPGFTRGQELLMLHNNKLVDATVLQWLGANDFQEGSRHMVFLGNAQAWCALNMYNHVVRQLSAETFEQVRTRYCEYIVSTEDKVEDAITGNELQIRDQLIFMALHEISDGVDPGDFAKVRDVPMLVNHLTEQSPKRLQGCHKAQPVLCRAGPGTGKTWMVKQSLFLTAERLSDGNQTGVRLCPIVVFVQRIVRLLRELGAEPASLLSDPNGMLRWYISNQYAEQPEERQMLLHAYDMRALVILVDGVDEAAGLREIVEAFVHYELVPSCNRLVVTSRPEGVDLEDYKNRFVVMNLLPLSQEQQRNVIQMQLQGNYFFEHLINIGECRKLLDEEFKKKFPTEDLRRQAEEIDMDAAAHATGEEATEEEAEGSFSQMAVIATSLSPAAKAARSRRMSKDASSDAANAMAKTRLKQKLLSAHLDAINKAIVPNGSTKLLDKLETEIKTLPNPCTRTAMQSAFESLGLPDEVLPEALGAIEELGLQRKQALVQSVAKRMKVHMPVYVTWYQVVEFADPIMLAAEQRLHILDKMLKAVIVDSEDRCLIDVSEPTFCNPVLMWHSATETGEAKKAEGGSPAKEPSPIKQGDAATAVAKQGGEVAAEAVEDPSSSARKLWAASVLVKVDNCDQLLTVLKKLKEGISLDVKPSPIDEEGGHATLTLIALDNSFSPKHLHPSHLAR